MSPTEPVGRIAVGNAMIDGVNRADHVPTFLVNLLGLSADEVRAQCEEVAILQAIAPVFRVAVLMDQPLFDTVRGLGWPVEHVPAREHVERTLGLDRFHRYVRTRIAIAESHFQDVTVVSPLGPESLTDAIARAIGQPGLVDPARLVHRAGADRAHLGSTRDWDFVRRDLVTLGVATMVGVEGSVTLTTRPGVLHRAIMVVGGPREYPAPPPWVSVVEVEFAPSSSLAFESHLYASVAREVGRDLTVVVPWRAEALLDTNASRWVDLGLKSGDHGTANVMAEFSEQYADLAGSESFEWGAARTYGIVRRLARDLA